MNVPVIGPILYPHTPYTPHTPHPAPWPQLLDQPPLPNWIAIVALPPPRNRLPLHPTMEAAATIIDPWRASTRECTARSHANRMHAKWEADKINARECLARSRANRTHAKCKADKISARECMARSRANRMHAMCEADKISARERNREREARRRANANAI